MATFPILYTVTSAVIDKPTYVVVVSKPGSFKAYRAGDSSEPYDSSSEYDGKSKNVYDDPRRGVTLLPTGLRNQLQETATVLEGASNADIKFALEALGEVTDDIIQKALEKADEED
jgi:hypothetical protein